MKNFITRLNKRLFLFVALMALFLTGCSEERGGVIVDSSGEQGGGTQPGGGGFAFTILTLMIVLCVIAMFAMDRIKKSKIGSDQNESADQD